MGMSKDAVLDALARFKVLQDNQNDAKFVAKEAGKTLITSADQSKLDGIASGAQVNLIESITVATFASLLETGNKIGDMYSI